MGSAPAVSLRGLGREDCGTLLSWIPSADALWQWSGPSDFTWPLSHEQLARDLVVYDSNTAAIACYQEAGSVIEGERAIAPAAATATGASTRWPWSRTTTGRREPRAAMAHAFYRALGFEDRCEHSARFTRRLSA
jgi:hypothetical protein